MMGTRAHRPASLPPISEYHFSRNAEFFNRIDAERSLDAPAHSLLAVSRITRSGDQRRSETLCLNSRASVKWHLASSRTREYGG